VKVTKFPRRKTKLKERPREKFLARGAASMSNKELIQLIVGTGTKTSPVKSVSAKLERLLISKKDSNQQLELEDLLKLEGIRLAKAARFLASLELARRLSTQSEVSITAPRQLVPYLSDICSSRQEHLVLFTLNGAQHILGRHLISVGILDAALAHPREIFYKAILDGAAAVVIAHNHPSCG
jgi:DNA repair protein RadC